MRKRSKKLRSVLAVLRKGIDPEMLERKDQKDFTQHIRALAHAIDVDDRKEVVKEVDAIAAIFLGRLDEKRREVGETA